MPETKTLRIPRPIQAQLDHFARICASEDRTTPARFKRALRTMIAQGRVTLWEDGTIELTKPGFAGPSSAGAP